MNVNKSVTFDNYDEFIKLVQRLLKEKKSFSFNGNINNDAQNSAKNFSINWISVEEI